MSFPGIFVLGFRDWFFDHLIRCLESIRRGAPAAPIVLADLGSRHGRALHSICNYFSVLVVENPRDIWSRSVALNLASRGLAPHEYPEAAPFVFTDSDMIFPASWFSAVEERLSRSDVWDDVYKSRVSRLYLTRARDLSPEATANLPVHWMPQPSDDDLYRASTLHPTAGQGGAMVIPRAWFEKVGGFDETYQTWGAEDSDLVLRAEWDGLSVEWFNNHTAWVAHQYHTRTWPTPEQVEYVKQNRAYLAERIRERGPIVRNQRGGV